MRSCCDNYILVYNYTVINIPDPRDSLITPQYVEAAPRKYKDIGWEARSVLKVIVLQDDVNSKRFHHVALASYTNRDFNSSLLEL